MARGLRFTLTASDRSKTAFGSFQGNLKKTQGLQRSWNAGLNSNRRAVQQLGFQVSDFAIQLSGGQNAMLAFTQQGGQMLQFFGPFGSIMAALLAVFGSLAIAFTGTGKALSELTPIMGVLQDDFRLLGQILGQTKELLIDFANIVVNNMDRIIITATLLAGLMVGKWVTAFVAARVATLTLAGALVTLRGAMIRTGIGALVIAAGELIYYMTGVIRAVGGVGNALDLMWQIGKEAFANMDAVAFALMHTLAGVALSIAANFVAAFAWIMEKWDALMNGMASGFNGIMEAIGSEVKIGTSNIGGLLRKAEAELSGLAVNQYKLGAEEINSTIPSLQKLIDLIGELDKAGKDIDVRDWFTGGGDKKGGKKASDKLSDEAKRIKKIFDDLQSSISTSLSGAFKALFDKTKKFTDAVRDMLQNILNKIADILLQPVFDKIAGSIAGAIIGGIPSFDGGGHTGHGSRTGGLDGRGGKLAMVHPKERIIDETKSTGNSGTMMNGRLVIELDDGLRAKMMSGAESVAIEVVQREEPRIVKNAVDLAGRTSREGSKAFNGI